MKIAFVTDPLDEFKTYKDSTFTMMKEAAARGHALHALGPENIVWRDGVVRGHARAIELTGTEDDWYRAGTPEWTVLADFDAVLMRKDPPFDMEYVYSTYLLELAEAAGARVFNRPRAIRDHNEKLAIARYPQFTAPTLVTRSEPLVREFLAEHRDIILKPLDGMGGMGIFRVGTDGLNLGSIVETLNAHGDRVLPTRFSVARFEFLKEEIGNSVTPDDECVLVV
jgi:glutathione synthase